MAWGLLRCSLVTPHRDQPPTARPSSPRLRPAAAVPARWRQRAVLLVGGTLVAAGFGAGFGAYAAALLGNDRALDFELPCPCLAAPGAAPALALESRVPPVSVLPEPDAEPEPAVDAALVAGGPSPWLLLDAPIDAAWATGAIEEVTADEYATALARPVELERLPAELAALAGTELTLYGDEGALCRAWAVSAHVLGRYLGDGYGDEQDPAAKWEMAADSLQLAYRLEPIAGDCADAIWARSSSLPAPSMGVVREADDALRRRALAAFRATPAHREVQRRFASEGHTGPWDRFEQGVAAVDVVSGVGAPLVIAEAAVGGCGTFDASLVAVWRLAEDGALEPLPLEVEREPMSISAAADVDGDGRPELFYRPDDLDTAMLESGADGYRSTLEARVPIYGCRC